MDRVGFVGIGAMGKPMAANLLSAGYELSVLVHRNRQPADELAQKGATVVESLSALAERSDIVVTMLPADREIREVYSELLTHLSRSTVCIDMTTALPDTLVEIAQEASRRGIAVVDAPVSGGVSRAKDGTLTIMLGGDPEAIERCRPLLAVMGAKIFSVGGVGSGKAMKMVNQYLNAANTAVASEALFLAEHMGVDPNRMCEIVAESSGGSWVLANKVAKFMIPRRFDPGFRLELMKKDIGLSMELAREHGLSLPLGAMVEQVYADMMDRGQASADYSVVGTWIVDKNDKEKR